MVWGSGEDEKHGNANGNQNDNGSKQNTNVSKDRIFGSAKGELWKYSEKNENFKLIMRTVEVRIVEQEDDDFLCCFEILKENGDLVLREALTNDLQIQYNKSDHSMLFSIINDKDDKVSVLQFIFGTRHDENELKWRIGVKLMEYNRQEAFSDLIKKKEFEENDKDWVCNQYENEAENDNYVEDENDWRDLDEDVVMRNFANLSIRNPKENDHENENEKHDDDSDNGSNNSNDDYGDNDYDDDRDDHEDDRNDDENDENDEHGNDDEEDDDDEDEDDDDDRDEEKVNIWEKAANKPISKHEKNRYIANAKAFNRSYVIRETQPGQSVLGYFKHNSDNELIYKGKVAISDVKGDSFTPNKAMQFKSDRNMLLLSDQKPGVISVFNVDRGKVVEEWNGKDEDSGGTLDIAPLSKFDELTDNTQLYGLNKNSMFLMDGRINKKCKLVDSKSQTYVKFVLCSSDFFRHSLFLFSFLFIFISLWSVPGGIILAQSVIRSTNLVIRMKFILIFNFFFFFFSIDIKAKLE